MSESAGFGHPPAIGALAAPRSCSLPTTRPHPAAAGRGKGRPQADPGGMRSTLPAARAAGTLGPGWAARSDYPSTSDGRLTDCAAPIRDPRQLCLSALKMILGTQRVHTTAQTAPKSPLPVNAGFAL
jgi:hypothetical protein